MSTARKTNGFEFSVRGSDDGTLQAAYFRFKTGKVARIRELLEGTLMASYDSAGTLLEITVLAPVSLSILERYIARNRRRAFRKFVKGYVPPALVQA